MEVRGLRKSYGDFEAVRGIDLSVEKGEVLAFLGPNGAGKTTTAEILEGFRDRTAGEVSVLGEDPAKAGRGWRERIGVVLQQCRMTSELTVRETLELYAGYYADPRGVDEAIDLVGLEEKADARAGRLSGGQQRRLDVAVALIGKPELLFLDEPTTGFDPTARRQTWHVLAGLRDLGTTVFLTTHYMDEAQALADRAMIIARGEVVAEGAPSDLGGREKMAPTVSFALPAGATIADLPPVVAASAEQRNGHVSAVLDHPTAALSELTSWAAGRGVELDGLELRRPSLEDVYLELTGQAPADPTAPPPADANRDAS
ncbi:ABC transporter ATP-binding protein [Thermoleophilia bacterium SCSIO 60948]|nr:ABC transporter ATP-binding protein [Thermoleophilia bacterium SCSIO 60948]